MFLQKKKQIGILACLFLIAVMVWIFVFTEARTGFLKVKFLDVGQGDAEFIETPDKKQILIDGGPDMSILEKIGKELPFYDRYIDLVILTHPEADHLNGLIEIVKRYDIGAIIMTGVFRNTGQYKEFLNIIKNKKIPVYLAKSGGEIDFGNNIKMDILYPFDNLKGKVISDSNNTSIVAKLIYGNFETLFTGDIEKSVENKLIKSGLNLKSDILKIAHHGSKTSSGEEFLKAVNAILAVIEVGKDNTYGHPHQEVLERLKNLQIFQTGKDGDIKILSDGINYRAKRN